MRNIKFVNGEIYHVYNRGVEKRDIYLDDQDRFRFIHDLFEFNDKAPAANIYYKLPQLRSYDVKPHKIKHKRELLVEILIFVLMPNHFHLLLRQKRERGISEFMQKLGTGYTMSFNQKHKRTGSLFQGPYKAILVDREAHFIHLPFYIHLNPLDLIMPKWLEKKMKDYRKAIKFLEGYRWSSLLDYIGKKNFPSVTQREFLLEFFQPPRLYKREMINRLEERGWEGIKDLVLE